MKHDPDPPVAVAIHRLADAPNPTRKRWAYATIVGCWLVTLAINAPGHLSFDSIIQLNEARTRSYMGFHPPLMSYLMMLFDTIAPGTALFLLFMQALFFGALLIVVRMARDVSVLTPLVVLACCAHPFVLLYQGIVWKDVLFANFAVFGFALLFAAARLRGWGRYACYAFSLLCVACGGLVRQNASIALPVLAVAIAYLEFPSLSLRAQAAKFLGGAVAAVIVMLAVGSGMDALILASAKVSPGPTYGMALVVLGRYDVSGIIAHNDKANVSVFEKRRLDVPLLREDADRYYTPERLDWLPKRFLEELRKLPREEFIPAWGQFAVDNFGAYLRHRLEVFHWMIWPPDITHCLPLHVGITGPPDVMAKLDVPTTLRPSDRTLAAYTAYFMPTPLYRHGSFLVVAVLLCVLLPLRYGLNAALPVLALSAAGILFTLTWTLTGVACDIRYMYFLPLAVFACLVMATVLEAERAAGARKPAPPHIPGGDRHA